MNFDLTTIFWPVLTIIFWIPTLIFIPRKEYKRFLIFGFILGGLLDVVSIILIGNIFGVFTYNAGPFQAFGIPIFIPLAFTFVWMLFLYFLPFRIELLIPYIIGFCGFSVLMGIIEQNLGLFKYHQGLILDLTITAAVFLVWFSLSAYVYRKYDDKAYI